MLSNWNKNKTEQKLFFKVGNWVPLVQGGSAPAKIETKYIMLHFSWYSVFIAFYCLVMHSSRCTIWNRDPFRSFKNKTRLRSRSPGVAIHYFQRSASATLTTYLWRKNIERINNWILYSDFLINKEWDNEACREKWPKNRKGGIDRK